jgi:hypothetical protein
VVVVDIKQISLTGEEVPMQQTEPPKPTKKYRTMQQLHGITNGRTCGECDHLVKHLWNKTYYKCELWYVSRSEATDIRKKNQACGLFKERVSEDGSSKDE